MIKNLEAIFYTKFNRSETKSRTSKSLVNVDQKRGSLNDVLNEPLISREVNNIEDLSIMNVPVSPSKGNRAEIYRSKRKS